MKILQLLPASEIDTARELLMIETSLQLFYAAPREYQSFFTTEQRFKGA